MDFSDVYLKAEQRIMVRKADADSYKDIDSFMRNRRILHTGGRRPYYGAHACAGPQA